MLPRGTLRRERVGRTTSGTPGAAASGTGDGLPQPHPHMTPLAERPADVGPRTVPGHGEGDLIKGARKGSAVGLLVARPTRLVMLARMEGPDARSARHELYQATSACAGSAAEPLDRRLSAPML